jgi:hypothetical protein
MAGEKAHIQMVPDLEADGSYSARRLDRVTKKWEPENINFPEATIFRLRFV